MGVNSLELPNLNLRTLFVVYSGHIGSAGIFLIIGKRRYLTLKLLDIVSTT